MSEATKEATESLEEVAEATEVDSQQQRIDALRETLDKMSFEDVRLAGKALEALASEKGESLSIRGRSAESIADKIVENLETLDSLGIVVEDAIAPLTVPNGKEMSIEEIAARYYPETSQEAAEGTEGNSSADDAKEGAEAASVDESGGSAHLLGDDDEIIWITCHPIGQPVKNGDLVINPLESMRKFPHRKVTRDRAIQLKAQGMAQLNPRVSQTPDKRL
jgi:ribosomal protein L12E/L44/L45/RPP1/RPP2